MAEGLALLLELALVARKRLPLETGVEGGPLRSALTERRLAVLIQLGPVTDSELDVVGGDGGSVTVEDLCLLAVGILLDVGEPLEQDLQVLIGGVVARPEVDVDLDTGSGLDALDVKERNSLLADSDSLEGELDVDNVHRLEIHRGDIVREGLLGKINVCHDFVFLYGGDRPQRMSWGWGWGGVHLAYIPIGHIWVYTSLYIPHIHLKLFAYSGAGVFTRNKSKPGACLI